MDPRILKTDIKNLLPKEELHYVKVDEVTGVRTIIGVTKGNNGQIDFSVTTRLNAAGGGTTYRVGVTSDHEIFGTDTTDIDSNQRFTKGGFSAVGDVVGKLGKSGRNSELEKKLRTDYDRYKSLGKLDDSHIEEITALVKDALAQLPMKPVDTRGFGSRA